MTLTEFTQYWTLTYGAVSLGDPATILFNPGSASFYVGDQEYIGISQNNLQQGITYNFEIKISGSSFDSSHYFSLYSSNTLLYTFSSSQEYSIPINVPSNNIELRYYGNDTSYSTPGALYYFRAIAPQTVYTETKITNYGTVLVGFSDGREDFNGELKGTVVNVTNNLNKSNPFLNYMYVSSSMIPNSSIFNPGGGTSRTTNNYNI
jgi:hypothetical protein